MTLVNGKISKPVSLQDIATCIGSGSLDLGTLCISPNIQKWAKNKPVDRNIKEELSDAARRKDPRDTKPTIFWGLEVGAVDWSDIHSATWNYVDRPLGDINVSPYRILDFAGYDHYAKPTLTGVSDQLANGVAYYNAASPFTALLEWNDSNNTTGVDIFQCAYDATTNLRNWYLCIAIDGYARAMISGRAGNIVAPVYYNGIQGREFSCPALPSSLQVQYTRTVSFFLADLDNANYDIKTQWRDVTGLAMGKPGISIPNMAGYAVRFSLVALTYGTWVGQSIAQTLSGVNVSFKCTEAPSETTTYQVVLKFGNAGQRTKTFTQQAGTTLSQMVQFATSELPISPTNGTTYTCTATLNAISGNNTIFVTSFSQDITWSGTSSN